MSSGAVGLAPVAVIAAAPIAAAAVAAGGVYLVFKGGQLVAEAIHDAALEHQRNRVREQQRRWQDLAAHAGRLRVPLPGPIAEHTDGIIEARRTVDELTLANDRFAAVLAEEQATLNDLTQQLAGLVARQDTLNRWAAEENLTVITSPASLPGTAVEEATARVEAYTADNQNQYAALLAARGEQESQLSDELWRSIRMSDVGVLEDDPLSASGRWRQEMRTRLAHAAAMIPVGVALPDQMTAAAQRIETVKDQAGRKDVEALLDQALETLQQELARSVAERTFMALLDDMTARAEAVDDYLSILMCDEAREEYAARRQEGDAYTLSTWVTQKTVDLPDAIAKHRAAIERAQAEAQENRQRILTEQIRTTTLKALRDLHFEEVTLDTVRPDGGRLFRAPGNTVYGKLIVTDDEGVVRIKPVRLGSRARDASEREQDRHECRVSMEFNDNTLLPRLEEVVDQSIHLTHGDNPESFALGNMGLTKEQIQHLANLDATEPGRASERTRALPSAEGEIPR